MPQKQKKDLENKKVVLLGGKPPKKQRIRLTIARVTMKKQKEREEKLLQERYSEISDLTAAVVSPQ